MSALAHAAAAPMLAIHASAVVVGECGILLRGPSGVGKSALALALIGAAQRRGRFARLVADDRVRLREAGGRLVMAPHPLIAGRIERRFIGIATLPHEPVALVRLIVDLDADEQGPTRLPTASATVTALAGVRIARIALPRAHPDAAELLLDHVEERVGTPGFEHAPFA